MGAALYQKLDAASAEAFSLLKENQRLRDALRLIAWEVEGEEPDLGQCMKIASEALEK